MAEYISSFCNIKTASSVFIDNNLFLFQIKADHDANETYPILTFGLKEEFGLYIDKHTEGVAKSEEIPVALIDAIKGQWIQVRNNVYWSTNWNSI